MNTRLEHIQNWQELAKKVNWSASALAEECSISLRTLERYFKTNMGKTPKRWLTECRQQQAVDLLDKGHSVKETASEIGYKHSQNFSRKFKIHWGCNPTEFQAL